MVDNMRGKCSKPEVRFSRSEERGISLIKESDMRIFCPGISTGGFAEARIALLNPERKIIATTIDRNGVFLTNGVIKEMGVAGQIEVRLEDVRKPMRYTEGYFDFIYARLILHYLSSDELDMTLKEFYRVLERAGRVFIVVRSTDDWEAKLDGSFYDSGTRMTTYPVYDSDGMDTGRTVRRYFHTVESISGHVKRAGFRVESAEES